MKRTCTHGCSLALLMCLGLAASAPRDAGAADDEAQRLREAIKDEHARGASLWIYNDLDEAMQRAREENKPLFVTFRCVPCADCKAFDAEVARGSEIIRQMAREHFVSVRQVEMKGVDLSLFQFDHDLNWAAMFVNADGVVYARYGTQSAEGPDAYNSIAGLKNTMQRVLALHAAYPENREALAGKRPPKKPYRTALEMPGLDRKASFAELTTERNCIHCHNIHDAEHVHAARTGTFTHEMLWRYPLPENVGLKIDADHGIRIAEVLADSPAAEAGLRPGEDVTHISGQPMTSIADMQWVLHHLPNSETTVDVTGSESGKRTLSLAAGWKRTDISWRGSLWSVSPQLRMWLPPLGDEERREYGIAEGQGAFRIRWINTGTAAGKAAQQAGLRQGEKNGDVVVALDGEPLPLKPTQFMVDVKLNYSVGEKLPLTILRDGRRHEVHVPLVE